MPTQIVFPHTFSFDPSAKCITFPVQVDGSETECLIGADALTECYGARDASPMELERAFLMHLRTIRDVVRELLSLGRITSDRRLRIESADCAP